MNVTEVIQEPGREELWIQENTSRLTQILNNRCRSTVVYILNKDKEHNRVWLTSSYLAKVCKISKAGMLGHLKILKEYKIVESKRSGYTGKCEYYHNYKLSDEYPRWKKMVTSMNEDMLRLDKY